MLFLIQIVTKLCHLEKFLKVSIYGYSKISNKKMEAMLNLIVGLRCSYFFNFEELDILFIFYFLVTPDNSGSILHDCRPHPTVHFKVY